MIAIFSTSRSAIFFQIETVSYFRFKLRYVLRSGGIHPKAQKKYKRSSKNEQRLAMQKKKKP